MPQCEQDAEKMPFIHRQSSGRTEEGLKSLENFRSC
jgi:hypothetical protein